MQNKGRGLVDRKLVKAPSNFIAGPSQDGYSILVLWWFIRGVWLFIVLLVIYKNRKIGKNRSLMLD